MSAIWGPGSGDLGSVPAAADAACDRRGVTLLPRRDGAYWKSRVVPLGDGDKKDQELCERPVLGGIRPVAGCMARISPADVVEWSVRTISVG